MKVNLFADDCVVYSTIKSGSCQAALSESVCKLVDWRDKRRMEIGFSKSVSMVVTTKKNPLIHTYVTKNRALEVVTSVKYLDFLIT